jgi:hypothetical protein
MALLVGDVPHRVLRVPKYAYFRSILETGNLEPRRALYVGRGFLLCPSPQSYLTKSMNIGPLIDAT